MVRLRNTQNGRDLLLIHSGLIHNGLMELKHYLQKHGITMASFGQRLDPPVSPGKVNHWLRGTRRVSLEEALQIESLTHGEVGLRELANPKGCDVRRAHA